jgi:large subunit ribosomal protein L30
MSLKAEAPEKKVVSQTKLGSSSNTRTQPGVLKLRQVKSPIGRHLRQRQTLIGLGLNKLHRVSIVKDTPSVRGMITAVAHLIKIETD